MEEEFQREYQVPFIRAREASRTIRAESRKVYINLVAKIGTVLIGENYTFRQLLAQEDEASQWWYHPAAYKDCENDPTYNRIIAVITIKSVAQKHGLKRVAFVGAPKEVIDVIRTSFAVTEIDTESPRPGWWIWLRGFGSRIKYLITSLAKLSAVHRWLKLPDTKFDVVFSSFWDWSVSWEESCNSVVDRYFKRLPSTFKQEGIRFGWFAWFEPHAEPGKGKWPLKDVLTPLNGRKDIVLLQAFLGYLDILKVLGDFRPLLIFLKVRSKKSFKEAFQVNGLNFYLLFSKSLLFGFLNNSIPHFNLVALATARACYRYQPHVTLSFLEHFPYSRAHYEGVRRGKGGTVCFAVQHAGYSHEKTFLFLHPTLEFRGQPDGFAIPHPDYVCAMGPSGRKLFIESGYLEDNVLLTGSPRYDHVGHWIRHEINNLGSRAPQKSTNKVRLLMVCSYDVDLELEMVEAVCVATRGMSDFRLFLRNHPFRHIDQHPGFRPYREKIQLTSGTLEEDLAQADLIVFTYSTVAEEAFISGKPVWQWFPVGYNGSALTEVQVVPQFTSVANLRHALQEFRADRSRFLPHKKECRLVLEQLFFRGDGKEAKRIVTAVSKVLS